MTYLFYDFETTGADPRQDCPVQFAAVRTDEELNELGEPQILYARLAPDCLPHPMAVLVTGLLPDDLIEAGGGTEQALAQRIAAMMNEPGTCAVGFNSMRFDAEMLRFLFWRNFIDPYSHEWRYGNSRWDVLDAARAFRVLRPGSMRWPVDDQGAPTLRLEALTAANDIEHGNAHDALADVRATIALCRLLRQDSPRLFDYLLSLRDKRVVAQLVDRRAREGFVHVSGRIATQLGNASLFASLGAPAGINNQRLLWDLRHDPSQLLDETVERLRSRRFLTNEEVSDDLSRLPVKTLHLNRAPVVVAASILNEDAVAERMALDRAAVLRHQAFLDAHYDEIADRLHTVVAGETRDFGPQSAEQALYDGFLPEEDRGAINRFQRLLPQDPAAAIDGLQRQPWQDSRMPDLMWRFVARNWPERLTTAQQSTWQMYLQNQLFVRAGPGQPAARLTFDGFFAEIERLMSDGDCDAQQQRLLTALRDWGIHRRQALADSWAVPESAG